MVKIVMLGFIPIIVKQGCRGVGLVMGSQPSFPNCSRLAVEAPTGRLLSEGEFLNYVVKAAERSESRKLQRALQRRCPWYMEHMLAKSSCYA